LVVSRVRYEAVFAADVAFVMDALVDEAFLAAYAKEIGATDWEIAVDRLADLTRTRLRLTVPTQGIHAVFARLVTSTMEIVETRSWPAAHTYAAAQNDGERRAVVAVDAAFRRRDLRLRGVVVLAPVAAGTRFTISGVITVNVPVMASLAESMAKQLIGAALDTQTKVMNLWTSGSPGL
jgi:hypothetical protein